MKFSQELAEIGLNFGEYTQAFHTETHKAHLYRRRNYDWCFYDTAVRRVVATHIAVLAHVNRVPTDLCALKRIDRLAIARGLKSKSPEIRVSAKTARRLGGYAVFFTAIIYRGLRLEEDSVMLANSFNVPPVRIRQILFRLSHTAARLAAGVDIFAPQPVLPQPHRFDWAKAARLRRTGMSYRQIAKVLGVSDMAVANACRKEKGRTLARPS